MKLINKFKSPNFNNRKSANILFIIIHYTALENNEKALNYLCDGNNKVSSHFLISQTGDIYKMVKEKHRAWHAGQSYWGGYTDINSLSIGIELDYSNNKLNNKFSKKMISSLEILIKFLKKKYKIDNKNILSHSDISPFRKQDPGPKFPWRKFYSTNLAFNPKYSSKIKISLIEKWFEKNKIKSKVKIVIFILSYIGYETLKVENNKNLLSVLIRAYQMHYLQKNLSAKIDNLTYKSLIFHFLKLVLTRQ